MEVRNFDKFWKEEFTRYADRFANTPEVLVELRGLALRAWEQCKYTMNNAPRD